MARGVGEVFEKGMTGGSEIIQEFPRTSPTQ